MIKDKDRISTGELCRIVNKCVNKFFGELTKALPEGVLSNAPSANLLRCDIARALRDSLELDCVKRRPEITPGVQEPEPLEDDELQSYADVDDDSEIKWWFNNAMISRFEPLFDSCEDNHDVERLLRKHGVIEEGPGDLYTDTESSCFYIYFKTKHAGLGFMQRLRAFLKLRAQKIREAYE